MKCECGSDAVGSPRHSSYCPKEQIIQVLKYTYGDPTPTLLPTNAQKSIYSINLGDIVRVTDPALRQYFNIEFIVVQVNRQTGIVIVKDNKLLMQGADIPFYFDSLEIV